MGVLVTVMMKKWSVVSMAAIKNMTVMVAVQQRSVVMIVWCKRSV